MNILITGSTDGIGKELAKKLLKDGNNVILHGRNKEKIERVIKELEKDTNRKIEKYYLADLTKKEDIYTMIDDIKKDYQVIDVLVNNAAALFNKRQTNKEGIELTFMLSVQCPYILFQGLYELLKKSQNPKVINTSSLAHILAFTNSLDFAQEKIYIKMNAYATAKLYVIWMTKYLSNKYKDIKINCYHPGVIKTKLWDKISGKLTKYINKFLKTTEDGIKTAYYLITEENTSTGEYFSNKKIKKPLLKNMSKDRLNKLIEYIEKNK